MKTKFILFFVYLVGFTLLVCSATNEQTLVVSDGEKTTDFVANPVTQGTTEVSTTTSTTLATTTETITSTETPLTSSTTEVKATTTEIIPEQVESPTEVISEPVTECVEYTEEEEDTQYEETNYCISESERIMLCNLVGREYGSDYVSVEEKAKVVAVVMNRVNSSDFPDTIYEVLTQPNQFPGYIPSESYTYQVTDSVIQAVDYYFSHSYEYGSYLYFEGDGTWNYFH